MVCYYYLLCLFKNRNQIEIDDPKFLFDFYIIFFNLLYELQCLFYQWQQYLLRYVYQDNHHHFAL